MSDQVGHDEGGDVAGHKTGGKRARGWVTAREGPGRVIEGAHVGQGRKHGKGHGKGRGKGHAR